MTLDVPSSDRLTSVEAIAHELARHYGSVAEYLRAWDIREEAIGRATNVPRNRAERLRGEAIALSDEADRYRRVAEEGFVSAQRRLDESAEPVSAESAHVLYEQTYDAWIDASKKAEEQEDQLILLQHETTLNEVDHLFKAAEVLHEARTAAEDIRRLVAAELKSAADYSQALGGPIVFDSEYREPALLRAAATTLLNPGDVAARKQWRSYAALGVPEPKRRAKEMADFLVHLDLLNAPAQAGESADKASKTYGTVARRLAEALKAAVGHADAAHLRDRVPVASSGWIDAQRLCIRLRLTAASRLLDAAEELDAAAGQDVEKELRGADWKSVLASLEFMSTVAIDHAAEAAKRLRAADTAAERRSSVAALFGLVAKSGAAEASVKQRELKWKGSLVEGDNYREESAALINEAGNMQQDAFDLAMASLEDKSANFIRQEMAMGELRSTLSDETGSWAEAASLQAAAAHAYLDGIVVYETAEYGRNENSKSAARKAEIAAREALAQANAASALRKELREVQRQIEAAEEIVSHWARASATDHERSRLPNWQMGLTGLRTRMSEIEEDTTLADRIVMERLTETVSLARELRHEALKQRFNDERTNEALEASGRAIAARTEMALHGYEFSAESHSEAEMAAIRARRYTEFAKANEMALAKRAAQAERRLTVVREMYRVSAVRFVEMAATEARERAAEEVEFNKLGTSAENARRRLAELTSAETLDSSV